MVRILTILHLSVCDCVLLAVNFRVFIQQFVLLLPHTCLIIIRHPRQSFCSLFWCASSSLAPASLLPLPIRRRRRLHRRPMDVTGVIA